MPPKKGQKMDLASFLGANTGGDWADDIDLPTAPAAAFERPLQTASLAQKSSNASTASFDISTVPEGPPFVAYVGNLSFNVTEHDLETFFGDAQVFGRLTQVKNIRLIMDPDTQRPKGYGYVDFLDRESLLNALSMNGESLQKRNIRINVAEGQKPRAPRHDDPKFSSDWRRPPSNADRSFRDQFSSSSNESKGGTFARRDHDHKSGWGSSGNAFQRREVGSVTRGEEAHKPPQSSQSKPKPNPFGDAAPRDELEIQRKIEENRKAREAAENEKKERAHQAEKAKLDQDKSKLPPKEDNIPTGHGSWRRASASKPSKSKAFEKVSKPTEKKEEAGFSSFKLKKSGQVKPKEEKSKAAPVENGKPNNAYSVLEQNE